MRGSFNNVRTTEIIRAAQKEWRTGYEQGKKGIKPFGANSWSASFRDGFFRGRDEFLGIAPKPLPEAPRQSPQEIARQQKERGEHLARQGRYISEIELEKCHPDFRRAYWQYQEELSEFGYDQDN